MDNPNWSDLDFAIMGRPVKDEKRYGLYSLASRILLEEGFYFSHCYWNLDDRVHQVPESVDCDCPGISLSSPQEDGSFYIHSVVEQDIFSQNWNGGIYINNEEQLRAAIAALALVIKNWHQRLIKLEQQHKEELASFDDLEKMIPYTEEMLSKDKELLIGVVEFDA